jgi:DNA-binding PadR family transcriptional regulator
LTSKEILQVRQGSLYPALHRLQCKGLLKSEWRESRYAGVVALVLES